MRIFFEQCLDLFFPLYCVVCKNKTSDGKHICDECLEKQKLYPKKVYFSLNEIQEKKDKTEKKEKTDTSQGIFVTSFFLYSDDWVKELIRRGKYKFSPDIFLYLASFILNIIESKENYRGLLEEILPPHSILVPVPLHYFRYQKRGFNQSLCIAKGIQNFFPEYKICSLIKRIKHTPHQSRLSRDDRKSNIYNAFDLDMKISQNIEKGTPIVLVDDVVSTASTLLEIKRMLVKKGYTHVSAFTLARGG